MSATTPRLIDLWRAVSEQARDPWLSSVADAVLAGRTPADSILCLLRSGEILQDANGDRRATLDGLWLAHEIGALGQPLLQDMVRLADDADEGVRRWAIVAIAHYAADWRSVGAMLRIHGRPYVRVPPSPDAASIMKILAGLEDLSMRVQRTAALRALPMVPAESLRAGSEALQHHPTHAAGVSMLLAPSLEPRVKPESPALLLLYWISAVLRLPKGAARERCRQYLNELVTHPDASVRDVAGEAVTRLE